MSCFSQIDQNSREDFNLTSGVDFNGVRSLVLGKVHGKKSRTENRKQPFNLLSSERTEQPRH